MTVDSTVSRTQFSGNGVTVDFPVTFKVFKDTDLEVTVDGVLQVLVTDYTVALSGSPPGDDGATVTFLVAPPATTPDNVIVRRVLPLTQLIAFPTAGKFPAEANEEAEDRGIMVAQQLIEELDRGIGLAVTSTLTGIVLPIGAGKGFRWNSVPDELQLVTLNDPGTINLIGAEGQIIQGGSGGVSETLGFGNEGDLLLAAATKWAQLPISVVQGAAPVVTGTTLAYTPKKVLTEDDTINGNPVSESIFAPGMLVPTVRATAPSGWLLCDGSEQSATAFEALFDTMVSNIFAWGLGTAVGNFTADAGTDILTLATHGLVTDDVVHLSNSGGALPAGLTANTKYFVINETTNDFQVSLTKGGSAVDFTDAGTGTHSVHDTFALPDMRGRLPLGKDDMGGVSADRVTDPSADQLGDPLGAEEHTLLTAEIPSGIGGGVVTPVSSWVATDPFTPGVFHPSIVAATFALVTYTHSGGTGGGDAPHPNLQPTQTYNWLVKT